MSHPFRFGVVSALARSGREWADKARRVEDLGFATLVMPDTLQRTLSPFPALAAAAVATRTLRVGTYVVAVDYRHPVMLAKEAATLDVVTDGRFELGIGAGRPDAAADLAMLGERFASGATRVARLSEALGIVKPLLLGETVTSQGRHYTVEKAAVSPLPIQRPLPILVAAGQRQLLTIAAREADVIALGVGPGTTDAEVSERIGWIREAAGDRWDTIELNLNLMAVAGRVPRFLQMTMGEAARRLADSDAIPVLKGSVEQMGERLQALRERFGFSYFVVGEDLMDVLAPVVTSDLLHRRATSSRSSVTVSPAGLLSGPSNGTRWPFDGRYSPTWTRCGPDGASAGTAIGWSS
jgi:probable F420-dependent oxidoreductase